MIRNIKHPLGALGIIMLLIGTSIPSALADNIVSGIADGKPWATTTSDGMSMWLTLNPDGTGNMSVAFMSKPLTWIPTADGFCLNGLPDSASKCIAMKQTAEGYVGIDKDGKTIELKRSKKKTR